MALTIKVGTFSTVKLGKCMENSNPTVEKAEIGQKFYAKVLTALLINKNCVLLQPSVNL